MSNHMESCAPGTTEVKLATYKAWHQGSPRIGALHIHEDVQYLVDLQAAYARVLLDVDGDPFGEAVAQARISGEMLKFLAGGEPTMAAAARGVARVAQLLATGHDADRLIAEGWMQRLSSVHLMAPIPRPGKIISVGANYAAHVDEGRATGVLGNLPSYPPAFLKMSSAVVGHEAPIVYPAMGYELDYEIEFSIVIGTACKDVAAQDWLSVVAGYTMINDLSLRDVILQEKDAGLVFVGKNFATACPMGPYLVTKDEIATPDDLALQLKVNGELRQRDRTSSMVHDCAAVVSYWSRLGLEPGDVITTGTPGGGAGFNRRHPERLLKIGDVVEAEVEGLGVLRNRVERESPRIQG
jgi:acylpyruvate hydrolase